MVCLQTTLVITYQRAALYTGTLHNCVFVKIKMAWQVVLITGCAQGLGKETALHLARDPQRRYKVYATMRNMTSRQDELKAEAGDKLDDTLFIRELDVTKQETIDKTVKEIIENEGKIDVLVNNAGKSVRPWWETCSMDEFYDVMEINYFGCVRMTKAVVPYMKEKRSGRIIQISSVLGFHAVCSSAQYVSSKFALEGFTESIAPPLRKFNIWVTLVEPGFIATPMAKQYAGKAAEIYPQKAKAIRDEDTRKVVTDILSFDPELVAGSTMQEPQEVAQQIHDIIVCEKPDFRFQTSSTIRNLAKRHMVDPTGNTIIDMWLKE